LDAERNGGEVYAILTIGWWFSASRNSIVLCRC